MVMVKYPVISLDAKDGTAGRLVLISVFLDLGLSQVAHSELVGSLLSPAIA